MATCETTSRYTLIKICNWETYQNNGETNNTPRNTPNSKETTHQQHTDDHSGNHNRRNNQNQVIREEERLDSDCPPANRKKRDSPAGRGSDASPKPSTTKKHSRIAEALTTYFNLPGEEIVPPTDRQVVDVVEAAGSVSETDILEALRYLYEERGLRPGTKNGPRHYKWFVSVIEDHFTKREQRREMANPVGFHEWEDRNQAMRNTLDEDAEMSSAFDVASEVEGSRHGAQTNRLRGIQHWYRDAGGDVVYQLVQLEKAFHQGTDDQREAALQALESGTHPALQGKAA